VKLPDDGQNGSKHITIYYILMKTEFCPTKECIYLIISNAHRCPIFSHGQVNIWNTVS